MDPGAVPAPTPRFTATAIAAHKSGERTFFRSANAHSATSEAEAHAIAKALARERAVAAANGGIPLSPAGQYPYPDRAIVEPVLERMDDPTHPGRELARLTRNSYLATVLNAYDVMFVDVDTAADTSNAPEEKPVRETDALDALASLCTARPDLGFRVYATRAGLRYLCTSRRFEPRSPDSAEILRLLLADPRYARLCRTQNCYRARLTPKYWRCHTAAPAQSDPRPWWKRLFQPVRMPDWVNEDDFATCHFVRTVGTESSTDADPGIALIVARHDAATLAHEGKPLA